MTRFLLATGVAALAIVAPAAADPGKNDKGKGGARVERMQSSGDQREMRGRSVEQAKKSREQSFERNKKFAESRFEARKKDDEQRFERSKKVAEQRSETRKKLFERQAKAEEKFVERRQKIAERQFKDREDIFKERNKRLEKMADRRDVVRFRDLDDDDRWSTPGRGRGLIDGCPPGLAKQNELCMPPGQYRKRMLGEVLPAAFRQSSLPVALRALYGDTDEEYYRYGNGYVYRVDRDSNLVNALLPLLGGGFGVGQAFPSSYMNNFVPTSYRSFYPDSADDYYRYSNGYVYEIDRGSGMIEDIIPMYDSGYGVGQMLPASYSYYNVPMQYRSWYQDDDDHYYRYAPGAIYQVDRDSNLITSIASLLTGGFGVGQQLPLGYDAYNVPLGYRDQYYDTADNWYRYNNGNIYQVDPTTRLITAVIQALT